MSVSSAQWLLTANSTRTAQTWGFFTFQPRPPNLTWVVEDYSFACTERLEDWTEDWTGQQPLSTTYDESRLLISSPWCCTELCTRSNCYCDGREIYRQPNNLYICWKVTPQKHHLISFPVSGRRMVFRLMQVTFKNAVVVFATGVDRKYLLHLPEGVAWYQFFHR